MTNENNNPLNTAAFYENDTFVIRRSTKNKNNFYIKFKFNDSVNPYMKKMWFPLKSTVSIERVINESTPLTYIVNSAVDFKFAIAHISLPMDYDDKLGIATSPMWLSLIDPPARKLLNNYIYHFLPRDANQPLDLRYHVVSRKMKSLKNNFLKIIGDGREDELTKKFKYSERSHEIAVRSLKDNLVITKNELGYWLNPAKIHNMFYKDTLYGMLRHIVRD